MEAIIIDRLKEHLFVQNQLLEDPYLLQLIADMAQQMFICFQNGGKVMFAGNGGSAADAQHLSTELAGRYYLNREPLAAETLLNDPAYMTAIANDFSFEDIFARALKAKGKKEDILVAMSTSGNSENILRAIKLSKEIGVTVMAWTGSKDQKMKAYADYYLAIPSDNTPRIQEGHMLVGHIICELVEAKIFGS